MILLAPVTALACEWQCARDTAGTEGTRASAPDSVDSCHRPEETSDASVSLRASLHDCGTHQPIATAPARLSVNRVADDAPLALVSQPRIADSLAPAAAAPLVSRVLAPPGPPSGSMTPLRI